MKLDPDAYRWIEITGGPESSYPIHHELSILGHDRDAGTIDLLIRFDDKGGHCHSHRHITTTSVLVLEGEQHLDELRPGGERVHKVRRAGEYHLTSGDAYPHMERGGPQGAVIFFSHHSSDGSLYEIVDEDQNPLSVVTLDSLVAMWEEATQ
ncbi:MAG TPA: hypothetical protein VMU14_19390 [Acidimicrobiales bacterium]|nr:hypothetical protein [Acidimicrobiales bacterium]